MKDIQQKLEQQIIEVTDRQSWRLFHQVPLRIYANHPVWIAPLESDIEKIFTPETNKAFQHGEARCFVLLDKQGAPAGRIAAFLDHERNAQQDFPTGSIGFFECTEDQDTAFALFARAEAYLQAKGVQAIDGPVNFGERDKFWGLLVKGFEHPPLYQENYHPPYYRAFFEAWGFRPFEQVLTLKGEIADIPADRFHALAQRVRQRYGLKTSYIDKNRLEKYAQDFAQVYNKAFKHFPYFKPLAGKQILQIFKQAKLIMDPRLVCFVYDGEQPVGFCGLLPEVNPFFKHANGKLNLWTMPGFLWRFKTMRPQMVKGVAFGIHPDFQRKGIFPLMVDFLHTPHVLNRYSHIVLATIRGHNKVMIDTCAKLGVKPDRVHLAFRKMLDETLPFEPFDFTDV